MIEAPSDPVEAEGWRARLNGQLRTHNPYSWSTENAKCIAWARGFAMGRTDLARRKRTAITLGERA